MSLRGYTAKVLGLLFVSIALGYGGCAVAQEGKGIRFWNLTLHTITQLRMSPAGENSWGPDQCQNDRDGTVEHDERLRITGVTPGSYDVRLEDDTGRRCIMRNIAVQADAIFSIEERQLTDCGQ
jgi:hypothetical protein